MFQDYERYDALGLAELVRTRQVSAEEVLDAAIERVERRNPALNAVVARMYDKARAAVRAGLPDGPLTGVPYLLKDLGVLCAGTPTTNGCALFRDAVADHDSEIVRRMRRAGLVLFGKTNTPEFGLTTSTEPRLFECLQVRVAVRVRHGEQPEARGRVAPGGREKHVVPREEARHSATSVHVAVQRIGEPRDVGPASLVRGGPSPSASSSSPRSGTRRRFSASGRSSSRRDRGRSGARPPRERRRLLHVPISNARASQR
jgi:Amidase